MKEKKIKANIQQALKLIKDHARLHRIVNLNSPELNLDPIEGAIELLEKVLVELISKRMDSGEYFKELDDFERGQQNVFDRLEAVMKKHECGFDYCQDSNDFWFDYIDKDPPIRTPTLKEALEKAEEIKNADTR